MLSFGCLKTILTPQAINLITHSIVGSGIAVKISLFTLQRVNDVNFWQAGRINFMAFGDGANFMHIHDKDSLKWFKQDTQKMEGQGRIVDLQFIQKNKKIA